MADVFLSYAKSRRKETARLAAVLRRAGYSVWWDTDLLPAQRFRQEIDNQLNACKAAIIIWTPESIVSDWVIAEADDARVQNKLVNTRMRGLSPAKIPKPFNQTHAVTLDEHQPILAAVGQLVGRAPIPPPRKRLGAAALWLSAGVISAVLFAALATLAPQSSFLQGRADGPTWDLPRTEFVGERARLNWKYKPNARQSAKTDDPVFFQVESATEREFHNSAVGLEPVEGLYTFVGGINGSRYWRVRAVEGKSLRPLSEWSAGVEVTQYDSAYRRMETTGKLRAYVSNSEYQDIFKWWDKNRILRGLDISLIRAIALELPIRTAKSAPLEVQVVPVAWSELLDAPREGRADVIVSAISRREQRAFEHKLSFSEPYFCTTQALLYRFGEVNRPIRAMISGKVVGYQRNTTSEVLVVALSRDATLEIRPKPLDRTEYLTEALFRSEIDFAVTDLPFAADAAYRRYRDSEVRLMYKAFAGDDFPPSISKPEQFDEYAIAVRAGEDELLQRINGAITKLKENGALARIYETEIREFDAAKHVLRYPSNDARQRDRPWECPR